MKIVIDIPSKTLEYYIRLCDSGEVMNNIEEIVASGTPLSEIIDNIKTEIDDLDVSDLGKMGIITTIFEIIDNNLEKGTK